jgi:phosphate transport system protein
MTRETLDRKLKDLRDGVLILGSMVEQATLDAVDSLKRQDVKSARRVYADDEKINRKRFELERDCLILIATQQPMAHDLRILAAVLEIITELERMGDYAKGIARICINTADEPLLRPLIYIPKMAELTVDMLHRALEIFIYEDVEGARLLPKEDDAVDDLYNEVHRDLLDYMIKDPSTVDRANSLMWAAHNLERMSVGVTNICERTIFVATGEMLELDVSDDESEERP